MSILLWLLYRWNLSNELPAPHIDVPHDEHPAQGLFGFEYIE